MGGAEVVSAHDGRFTLLIQHTASTGECVAVGVKLDVVARAEILDLRETELRS